MTEKISYSMEDILKEDVFFYFSEISKIPRNSRQEEQISEYLVSWAKDLGLYAVRDEYLNVIIKKPGTQGYENSAPVILQAHMDMVCEKTSGSRHDFTKDPIQIVIDGDLLKSNGETTLGADNGLGVAYIMSVLASKDISHPPLEILLTSDEEGDFYGVEGLNPSHFTAKQLINVDHAVCDEVLSCSCGGHGIRFKLPAAFEPVPDDFETFEISVSNMHGGHSGEDIHRGFGNAIIVLARALKQIEPLGIKVGSVSGGGIRIAIPRDAKAIIFAHKDKSDALKNMVQEAEVIFKDEYSAVAPSFMLSVVPVPCENPLARCFSEETEKKVISSLTLFPDGIQHMHNALSNLVECSCNLGVVETKDDFVLITAEIRMAVESSGHYIMNKIDILAELVDAEVDFFTYYAPWKFNPNSLLREKAASVYQREFNEPLRTVALHAGIECGSLVAKMPGLDAISIGPDCWYFHSVSECASIPGTLKTWHFLKKLLEELK